MSETTDPGCAGGSAEARRRTFDWFTPLRFGILLALLVFAAFPQVLLGLETFVVRDYGFFAYPLARFQQECFRHGELPLWNPFNNCGVPFLAQWNTMPLYPPALIYLLLPLQWSLSFFCLLHLWFAGFGMFFLARRWTSCSFAAAFAGVAFAFNGLTLNLLMWPSHIATLSWMPWVVLAVELAWREGGRKIILAAFAGALQMLAGGPEIIFLTWILLLALWIQQFVKGESPACLNALAVSIGCGTGDCAGSGATAAVPRPRRPFAAWRRLRGYPLVHARLGLGEFSGADGFRHEPGPKGCSSRTASTGRRLIISASERYGWRCGSLDCSG